MRRRLHIVGKQRKRRRQGQAAEAHIGKIGLPVKLDPQQHMPVCRDDSIRHIPAHAHRQPRHLKAENTQDGEQEQILLKAVATPAALDELVLERGELGGDQVIIGQVGVRCRAKDACGPRSIPGKIARSSWRATRIV